MPALLRPALLCPGLMRPALMRPVLLCPGLTPPALTPLAEARPTEARTAVPGTSADLVGPPSPRQAASLLVAAFSRAARSALASGEPDPLPTDGQLVYDAAVTVLMRMAVLLVATQRGLVAGGPSWQQRSDLWRSVLSTSPGPADPRQRAGRQPHPDGPSLFGADHVPFLTATTPSGRPALTIPEQVLRPVLDAVRAHLAPASADLTDPGPITRLGELYEGLVGYTTLIAKETVVGLLGVPGREPEIPLATLEHLARADPDPAQLATAVQAWCRQHQKSARLAPHGQLRAALSTAHGAADRALRALTCDAEQASRLRPFLGIAAHDPVGEPIVYLPGSRQIRHTSRRGDTGGHYTDPALAADVVRAALDRSLADPARSGHPLRLLVADIACGAGAFLIPAARDLAQRLVQTRTAEIPLAQVRPAPARRASASSLNAAPASAAALREVLARCIHGVDVDLIAVAVCKASLWLLAADETLPMSFLDHKIRHGDALVGPLGMEPGAEPAGLGGEAPVRWPTAFPEAMARGGFDVIVGNPPWVSHAGRAARPISAARRDYFAANYASFAGYRSTHALFMERTQRLLRPDGVGAVLVPTSVSDLAGYAPARRAVTALSRPEEPMPSYGDGRFSGVFQPCMALTTTRRADPAVGQDRAWSLQSGLSLDGQDTLALLRGLDVFPPELFGDVGLRSTAHTRRHMTPLMAGPAPPGWGSALLQGKDIAEFACRQPRVGLPARLMGAGGARQLDAQVVIRQTARYPIAAPNPGWNFRNSLLAVFCDTAWDRDLMLGLLNSGVLRWFHYHRFRDAREGMPQVKVGHLRRYPAPPSGSGRQQIRCVVSRWDSCPDRAALDAAVADAYGLPSRARDVIARWRPPR